MLPHKGRYGASSRVRCISRVYLLTNRRRCELVVHHELMNASVRVNVAITSSNIGGLAIRPRICHSKRYER